MKNILVEKSKGSYRLRTSACGKSIDIWIGKLNARQFREYDSNIHALLEAKRAGVVADLKIIEWANALPDRIHKQLMAEQLCPPQQKRISPDERKVGNFTQAFIDEQGQLKPRTIINYHQARTWLLKSIPADTDIGAITEYDLQQWQASMKGKLALTTRNKHLKRVKTMLGSAVSKRVLAVSPAKELKEEKGRTTIDRSRQVMVTPSLSEKILKGLPNVDWRLTFALMRYQGFRRCEVFGLDWEHIHWGNSVIVVHSDKTGIRECPIFKDTRPYLDQARVEASQSLSGKVIRCHSSIDSITPLLIKHIKRICKPEEVYPKICQQLRSTRRTELQQEFSDHVLNEWLGHDSKTAAKHYLQITPGDLKKAHGLSGHLSPYDSPEPHRNEPQQAASIANKPRKLRISVGKGVYLMPPQGLEPWTR
jgi:integrase